MSAICAYPFSRLRFWDGGEFIPCCMNWLTQDFHKLKSGPAEEVWNGPAAQELRRRVLKGDYSFCRRELCQIPLHSTDEFRKNPNLVQEAPLSTATLDSISRGETRLSEFPGSISIAVDRRCNLKCPGCRNKKITRLKPEEDETIARVDRMLESMRESIRQVYMAENGEVFFSPWLRQKLKQFAPPHFPNIETIHVITNGLLMTPKAFEVLKPGSDFVKNITISIDAGSAETYKRVRNGSWTDLMANLEWACAQRAAGRFKKIAFNFVVRRSSFNDIPKVIELAERLGVDDIYFVELLQRARSGYTAKAFSRQVIHSPKHPLHEFFRETCIKHLLNPKVHFRVGGIAELQMEARRQGRLPAR